MESRLALLLSAIGLLGVSLELQISFAQESRQISQLKPLCLTTQLWDSNHPTATIVAGAECQAIAVDLQRNIKRLTGVLLPLVPDVKAQRDLPKSGNLIALGHFGNNRVLERLYYRWYMVVDGAQPGSGGYVLQTIHNPDAQGINVIVVGGSDLAGVRKSARRLAEKIKEHGRLLPRLFEVELGKGKGEVLARGEQVLEPKREWPTIHPMEIQQAIAEAGMLYVYTGGERFAAAYKGKLAEWLGRWLKNDPYVQGASDDLYRVIITWDLLEEAPVFTDEERLWITQQLWELLKIEHARYDTNYNYKAWLQVKDQPVLRENHRARFANTYFFGGRYFHQYYGMVEARQWLDEVRTYWNPQMTSFAPQEGLFNMALITLTEATTYALAENIESFLSRDVLGRIADKGIMQTAGSSYFGGGSPPLTFWCLAAHRFNQPEYLQPILVADPQMNQLRLPWRLSWELGRSFWDGRVPSSTAAPQVCVQSMPLSQQYYDQSPSHGPKNVPFEKTFDFVTMRGNAAEGNPGGSHLVVSGMNTGSYSKDAANSITQFVSHGREWLVAADRVATAHTQNSVSVVRNGEGRALPAYARLDRAESQAQSGIVQTVLPDYNGTDWHRNIMSVPGKWFLVVDELVAREPGDYVLETRWSNYSHGGFEGNDFVFLQRGEKDQELEFRLTGAGWTSQYVLPWLYSDYLASPLLPFPAKASEISLADRPYTVKRLCRRWAGPLEPGDSHVFANLFYVHPRGENPPYLLKQLDKRHYAVEGNETDWHVAVDQRGRWFVSDDGKRTSAVEPRIAETSDPLKSSSPPGLAPKWQRTENARVLSSTAVSVAGKTHWVAGMGDGRIFIMSDKGEVTTTAPMPGMVLGLCAVDLDGNGDEEIVVGSDTGGVRAFKVDGSALWAWTPPPPEPNPSWRQSMGRMRPVITDVVPLDIEKDGRSEILAFGLYFYLLDGNGRLTSIYDTKAELLFTDLVGLKAMGMWRTPENTLVLAAGDVNGDGTPEIVGDLTDPGYSYVRVWSAKDGKRLAGYNKPPSRYLGNAIKVVATADVDADGKDEFAVGADAYLGQLAFYKFPEGLVWHHNVGSAVEVIKGADLDGDGKAEIIIGTELGHVQGFDGEGKRLFVAEVGGPVASMAIVEGRGSKRLWVGTANGRVLILDGQGRRLAQGEMITCVDHLTVRGEQVLATTAEGRIALYNAP